MYRQVLVDHVAGAGTANGRLAQLYTCCVQGNQRWMRNG
jgi:hypothetical protein